MPNDTDGMQPAIGQQQGCRGVGGRGCSGWSPPAFVVAGERACAQDLGAVVVRRLAELGASSVLVEQLG